MKTFRSITVVISMCLMVSCGQNYNFLRYKTVDAIKDPAVQRPLKESLPINHLSESKEKEVKEAIVPHLPTKESILVCEKDNSIKTVGSQNSKWMDRTLLWTDKEVVEDTIRRVMNADQLYDEKMVFTKAEKWNVTGFVLAMMSVAGFYLLVFPILGLIFSWAGIVRGNRDEVLARNYELGYYGFILSIAMIVLYVVIGIYIFIVF